jgi:hypothetical protein
MAVMGCIMDGKDIPPNPYAPGSIEASRWDWGVADAWEDEHPEATANA